MIKNYFETFEKDKRTHNKKGHNFKYPIVKIKNNNVNITFSNLYSNTASFLINMVKKVYFKNPDNEEACLIFFKQDKKRNYDR